jgi:tRNA-uridine 2-sulfurtransferase
MADADCAIAMLESGVRVTFDEPQWAPTPGQYLVLYDGDTCLGGGVIVAAGDASELAVREHEASMSAVLQP